MGNPGVYASNDGLTVYDAAGLDRVTLGQIGGGDYGLKVIGSDGTTVIIDGTSNMFKILASGTATVAIGAAFGNAETVVVFSGLGVMTTTPAHISYVSDANTVSSAQYLGWAISSASATHYVALTSGGAVTSANGTLNTRVRARTTLDGSNFANWGLGGDNFNFAGTVNRYGRYYILAEAAL